MHGDRSTQRSGERALQMKISFIVPVYNVEEYLETCLNSLQAQTIPDFEAILVDDGSTDSSGTICDEYVRKDCRFRVIHQTNGGLAVARNSGQKVAVGEWISFVDSDDWIELNYIEKLLPYMEQDFELIFFQYEEAGLRYNKLYRSTKNVHVLGEDEFNFLIQDSIDTGIGNRLEIMKPYRAQAWTKIYRRSFLYKYSLYANPRLRRSQDVMFSLEVYNYAREGILIPEVLYHYRIVGQSLSHQYSSNQVPRLTYLMEEMGKYITENERMQKYLPLYEKRVAITLVNFCLQDYCHPQNTQRYRERKKAFLGKRQEAPFSAVYSRLHVKDYGFPKGILVFCVKYRCFLWLLRFIMDIRK